MVEETRSRAQSGGFQNMEVTGGAGAVVEVPKSRSTLHGGVLDGFYEGYVGDIMVNNGFIRDL